MQILTFSDTAKEGTLIPSFTILSFCSPHCQHIISDFCTDRIYLLHCTCNDAADDLFLQDHVQDQDRKDAQQQTCHDRSVIR